MVYYIFPAQIFTIFLSMSHLTAITFPSKVYDYVGGQTGDFAIYEVNMGRSLVFEAKKKEIDRNFIVFHKDSKYHFNIKYSDEFSDKDIEIREASTCNFFELLDSGPHYQIFECPKSLLLVNKSSARIKAGDLWVSKRAYLSKGPPVYLNGKLVYFKGTVR